MKINHIMAHSKTQNQNVQTHNKKINNNPSFKGLADLPSFTMQFIENQGYLMSFLIQDGLGMTLPRTYTGFKRDKEITGKYNKQEGLEVFGREGLTGPFVISVAPAVLWCTAKFCRSTNTNTRLIKRFGESLKQMVKSPEFDKSIKNDKDKFKQAFYKYNIESIYKNSIPNDKSSEETIKYIQSEFSKYDTAKNSKERETILANINNKFNEKLLENSSELYDLNNLKVGKDKKSFKLNETLIALSDYGRDAIQNNKNAASIDELAAENIKNNFAAKRLFTNIANVVLTLGGLSVLPKLYIRSQTSPGAKTLELQKQMLEEKNKAKNTDKENETTFKGKGINNDGMLSKIGKYITKKVPERAHELLEYMGYNFSKLTFALLTTVGLLLPRGLKAWDRAQIDENGKRDKTELKEILFRDTISSLSVVFAVPMMTKAFVGGMENKYGYVLSNKASLGKSFSGKLMDIIYPFSKLEVLSLNDLNSIYGDIDTKAKLLNFAEFINKNDGDLEKILSKSDNHKALFNDKTFTLESIKNSSIKEKNQKIIDLIKKIETKDANAKNEIITKLMKSTANIKDNKIVKVARNLNSWPGFISTLILSPILLGVLIPKITYSNTKKANNKRLEQTNSQTNNIN